MESFARGEADVLVATSVIEVGIDVPNATVMLIEAAERYGLSQLHQLRGRVGRGEHELALHPVRRRASCRGSTAIADERDGFRLAEVDLELRGAGTCSARASTACPSCAWRGCPRTPSCSCGRATARTSCCAPTRSSSEPEHALLRDAVVARFGSELDPIPA